MSIKDLSSYGKYVGRTKETISDRGVAESRIKLVPANTLIMSFKLSLGKTAITVEPTYTNEAIMAFLDKKTYPIDLCYMYHQFSAKDWGAGTNTAVMGKTLNKKTLGATNICVPSIEVQRGVARRLDFIYSQIELTNQQLAELDSLVKSRFVEMFGDQKTNSLGLPTSKLGDVAFVGSSKRVFKDELVESGVPFYRGTEVGALAFGESITPELFITRSHYQELVDHAGKPEIGDLLMPSICPDGQIWLVDTEDPFYFKDGRVLWVKPDRSIFNSTFLQYAMRDRFISDFESFASGTTFAELKIFVLKNLVITVPRMEMQNEFAAFVQQADKLRVVAEKEKQTLQTLYDSLAQEYFAI